MAAGVFGSAPPLACCVAWVELALLAEVISRAQLVIAVPDNLL